MKTEAQCPGYRSRESVEESDRETIRLAIEFADKQLAEAPDIEDLTDEDWAKFMPIRDLWSDSASWKSEREPRIRTTRSGVLLGVASLMTGPLKRQRRSCCGFRSKRPVASCTWLPAQMTMAWPTRTANCSA